MNLYTKPRAFSSGSDAERARFAMSDLGAMASRVSLDEVLRVIRRRWTWLVGALVGTLLTAFLFMALVTPVFQAQTSLLVSDKANNVIDLQAVMTGAAMNNDAMASEIEVLRSTRLVGKVVDELDMVRLPEFNLTIGSQPLLRSWFGLRPLLVGIGLLPQPTRMRTPEERAEFVRNLTIATVAEALSVEQVGTSYVIEVKFSSRDPRLAQKAANALANAYIVDELDARLEATQRADRWLNDRLSDLRSRAALSENKAQAFRSQAQIFQGRTVDLASEQISDLSNQLIAANGKTLEAEARLAQARRAAAGGGVDTMSDVLDSATIINLRTNLVRAQQELAETAAQYGDRHPRMTNARAQVDDMKASLAVEIGKVVKSLENDVAVARSRESSLRSQMGVLKGQAVVTGQAEVQLRALEREAEADSKLLGSFLDRSRETGAQADSEVQAPATRIIEPAILPIQPLFPNPSLVLVVAIFGGLLLGVLLALAVESLDDGFRSSEQVEDALGVAVLGIVPRVEDGTEDDVASIVIDKPISAYSEALRGIYTSLRRSNTEMRTLTITSSTPSEGKTSFAVSLARVVAMGGRRVLLIDADMRRPAVHKVLGVAEQGGLSGILRGEVKLDDVLRFDQPSGLHYVTAGSIVTDAHDLLSSPMMLSLLSALRNSAFELIIIDTPPVSAVADSRVVGALTDAVTFLVRWGVTPRIQVRHAFRKLVQDGIAQIYPVVSIVDRKLNAMYGYGDSYTYYGKAQKYYTE